MLTLPGKTDRLITELEKKYSVSLASYAVPLAPDAVLSTGASSDDPVDDGSRAPAESAPPSSTAPPVAPPVSTSAVLEPSAVGGPREHQASTTLPPPAVLQLAAPATAAASDSAVVSLRAELRRLRGQYDALRNEKEAEVAAARRETRVLEDSMRDARKQQERMQGAAVERDSIANQRYAALAARAQELQGALDAAREEALEARVEANTRAEQLADSLETVHWLRWQLHLCLGHMGLQFDPYTETNATEVTSHAPLQSPSTPATAETSATSDAPGDLRAEVSLLRAVNASGEEKLASQARVIEDMTATLSALKESAEATSGSGAALAAALAESKAALGVAEEELARERSGREADREEVRRLQGTITLAVATRREIQALGERERRVVEDAARKRIEEATAQVLMEREDSASEACEAWDFERKNAREEVELMKLEMDSLSRAVVDLRNERNNLDDEAERLRAELTRAAEKMVDKIDNESTPTQS